MDSGIVTNWSESPTRAPFATIAIGLICLAILVIYSSLNPVLQQALIDMWGMRPVDVTAQLSDPLSQWWASASLTLFSALFIHASWLHLVGNLAYLWVFGMAVEQRLGWLSLLLIFLVGGALANLMVAIRVPQLETPVIGASGAVSAVVGAYLGLFPSRRIGLFLPLGLYLQFARVPAILVIGSWFTLQLVYTVIGPINGTVAWWTHLAGFVLGLCITLIVKALALVRIQK
jgi:membrane associated rhomboid family serine protease